MNDLSWTPETAKARAVAIRKKLMGGLVVRAKPAIIYTVPIGPESLVSRLEKIESLVDKYRSTFEEFEAVNGFWDLGIEEMIAYCSLEYEISVIDIKSARRDAKVTAARMKTCWMCKTHKERSLPEIGKRVGNRDHSTILHAVRKIERLRLEGKFIPPVFDQQKADLARRMVGLRKKRVVNGEQLAAE